MDIHRSRFVPFTSSAINALAFSHTEAEHGKHEPESLRLAIGRANGNIEIWNPANGAWLQEKVFHGGKDRSVEGLAWTQEPDKRDSQNKIIPGKLRLFSIGYSSSVTEWDLTSGLPVRHSNGNHSEVWCFAAQPRQRGKTAGSGKDTNEKRQNLVAGCADGTIVLLSTEDGELTFDRFVSRATNKKARALSIAFKDNDVVLAGFADSTIRVFDTRNGNVLRNISLGSGPYGGPKEILVWKVKCLPNGDFVSGDSTGEIRFYNGKTYSQTQRISGHEADVLDLAVSQDGTSIFSAGMDRRTCFYTSKKGAAHGQSGKWRKVSHKRYHEHDVKAMATFEGPKMSIMVSGGIDTQPVVVPIRQFGVELSRGLPALPPSPPLASALNARLVLSWWNTEVRIWRVKPQDDGTEKPKVVARLALQGEENITSVSISQDGSLLSVATVSSVKLFQLIPSTPGTGAGLRIRKLDMPAIAGARNVKLAPNGKWLAAVTPTDQIQLVRIVRTEDPVDTPRALDRIQYLHRLRRDNIAQNALDGLSGSYHRSIAHVDFSSDGKLLAVVDLAGFIDTWVVEGNEDSTALEIDVDESSPAGDEDDESDQEDEEDETKQQVIFLGQSWRRTPSGHLLPRLDAVPVLLSFQRGPNNANEPQPNGNPAVHPTRHNPHPHSHELPSAEYRLLVVSAEHQLYLFDVMAGRLSDWSRRNPIASFPREYRQLDLPAKGCVWDMNGSEQRVWLYGEKWLFMFDLTRDFPAAEQDATASKKRKRGSVKDYSGAGGIVSQQDAPVMKVRKFEGEQGDAVEKSQWVDVNATRTDAVVDKDDEEDDQALVSLRRTATQDGELLPNGASEEVAQRQRSEPWWHTLKYRPILGIVPVSGDDSYHAPEVVLVERPSWDLDLPPRFVGTHEE